MPFRSFLTGLLFGLSVARGGSVEKVVPLPNQPSVTTMQRDAAGNLLTIGGVPVRNQYVIWGKAPTSP